VGKLGEELRNEGSLPRNRFRVDELLNELNEEDRRDLLAAIKDENLHIATITRVLRRNGHAISENAIRNYRRWLNDSR
jgi:hypothetical protein